MVKSTKTSKPKNTETKDVNTEHSDEQRKTIPLTPELANNLFNSERKRYDAIINDKSKVQKMIFEVERTIFSLEELGKTTDDSIFVNMGSGVYLNAKVLDKKSAKFMVGSDVFLEKDFKQILATLNERKEKLVRDFDNLQRMESNSQNSLNQLYSFLMNSQKQEKIK